MIDKADAIEWVKGLADDEADLLFTSPPYESARVYGELGFDKSGEKWVEWMVEFVRAAVPKVRGVTAIVCEGRTKDYRYSMTPVLLAADLHRQGFNLRKPPIYKRNGIPGSGGPDWLRNDYEFVVCVTRPGRLPWSDNTACGHPPKYGSGGSPSHRKVSGDRVGKKAYRPPTKSNPGNVIDCGAVGGGNLGHPLAHDNEAPFDLDLAEFFVKSFCPPGGLVVDPFCGSSSTGHAALVNGRRYRGCDLRQSQVDLSQRRLADVTGKMKGTAA